MTSAVLESYDTFNERKNDNPEGYKRIAANSSKLQDDPRLFNMHGFLQKIPMWKFTDTITLESVKPIGVRLSQGEELVLAENENLGIYAYGETRNEAIKDFSDQLIEFYQHYLNTKDSDLTNHAREIKKLYMELFKPVSE